MIFVPLGPFLQDFEMILDGFLVHCFAEWCQGVRTDFRLKLHLVVLRRTSEMIPGTVAGRPKAIGYIYIYIYIYGIYGYIGYISYVQSSLMEF